MIKLLLDCKPLLRLVLRYPLTRDAGWVSDDAFDDNILRKGCLSLGSLSGLTIKVFDPGSLFPYGDTVCQLSVISGVEYKVEFAISVADTLSVNFLMTQLNLLLSIYIEFFRLSES